MLLHFLGTLCMAPITQPKRVLDLGTGTGGWVKVIIQFINMDMIDELNIAYYLLEYG
jgi:spermidine synthase